MADAAHTPGPWVAIHDPGSVHGDWADNGGYRIDAPDDRVEQLAYVWCLNKRVPLHGPQSEGPNFGDVRAGANARLIAAAPDMLAALKEIGAFLITDPHNVFGIQMQNIAARAITKAEGRS